jgi:hypothetical protein
MTATKVNEIVLSEKVSKNLAFLQQGYAQALASGLDDAIGFLLEESNQGSSDPRNLINVLGTLHNARTGLLGLIPEETKGGSHE